jgi:hypothetical protein
MNHGGNLVALALLLVSPCAEAAHSRLCAAETIVVRFRFPYDFCAGVCPSFEMKVSWRGAVVTHGLFSGKTYHFHATSSQVEAFRRVLSAIRPARESRLDRECEHARQAGDTADPLDGDPRPDDFEIRWNSARSRARLTSCYFTHRQTHAIVRNALRALGADPVFGYEAERSPSGPVGEPKPRAKTSARRPLHLRRSVRPPSTTRM